MVSFGSITVSERVQLQLPAWLDAKLVQETRPLDSSTSRRLGLGRGAHRSLLGLTVNVLQLNVTGKISTATATATSTLSVCLTVCFFVCLCLVFSLTHSDLSLFGDVDAPPRVLREGSKSRRRCRQCQCTRKCCMARAWVWSLFRNSSRSCDDLNPCSSGTTMFCHGGVAVAGFECGCTDGFGVCENNGGVLSCTCSGGHSGTYCEIAPSTTPSRTFKLCPCSV